MKRLLALLLALCCLFGITACDSPDNSEGKGVTVTDALGNTARLTGDCRVVALHASFADCWLLSGGTLVGVTEDALSEHGLAVGDAAVVGTAKTVDEEALIALSPDYVILSADLVAHLALDEKLTALGIPHGYFRTDTFADYKALMAQFTAVHNRPDLYDTHVRAKEARIAEIKKKIPAENGKTVLLMRVYASGVKAKRADNLAGQVLEEYHLHNIANDTPSLLEDMSMEHIIAADPDYIFVLTMGSEEAALAYLAANLETNPAWQGLSAVKNGNYHILPKALFHHKPNERWDESYEHLARLIYPAEFTA